MRLRWHSNENFLNLVKEVDGLTTQLSKTNHLSHSLKDLNNIKLSFGADLEGYINDLLRRDSYLWTLYGEYIQAFNKPLCSSKTEYEKWYKNQLLNIDEEEKGGRWERNAKYALKVVQREYYWDQKKIIQALESRYVRNKAILQLSNDLYLLLMEKIVFHNALLNYIDEDGLASAMYGGALVPAADKYLETEGYKQIPINTYEYYDYCGYR
jgi:hypothetical protein